MSQKIQTQRPVSKVLKNMEIKQNQKPQSSNVFYQLMQEVGMQGKYQTFLIIFCSILCFQAGIISLGTPYYFAIAPYTNCPSPYQAPNQCTKYVCSLPFKQRAQFLHSDINKLRTLGNQFGDYHCQNSDSAEIAKGMPFFGAILGFFVTGILGDNIGRRLTLIICLVSGILGYLIIIFSKSLVVASIGLFVCGFGMETCFNLGLYFVSQTLQNTKRQKIAVLIQAMFCIAGIFSVIIFYIIKDWKTIFIVFCLIPLILCLAFNIFFVKQTSQFLVKRYSVTQIRQTLRFIAKMNGKSQNFDQNEKLSQYYIDTIKKKYIEQTTKDSKRGLTYFDLFRYNSLRKTTILVSLVFGCTAMLYYAPLVLVNSFGFNFYVNGILVNISELATYFLSYSTISKIKRKKVSQILFALASVFCFILIFLHTEEICLNDCWNFRVVFQLILVITMRFCVSFQYQILFIYAIELFPVQITAMALSLNCVVASIPIVFINEIINVCTRIGLPNMVIFSFISILNVALLSPLLQTFGKQPAQKIQQIELATNKAGQINELVQQAS